jgi:hypothetical protein
MVSQWVGMVARGEPASMVNEQRKAPRRHVEAIGFLYTRDGHALGECRMQDVSAGGAKLSDLHLIAGEVPDQILLSLSKRGTVLRRCAVIWRDKDRIGVRFLVADSA